MPPEGHCLGGTKFVGRNSDRDTRIRRLSPYEFADVPIRIAASIFACVLLQACSSLPRLAAVPPELTEKAEIPGIPYARVWLDRDLAPFIQAVVRDIERETRALELANQTTNPMPPVNSLAISGGGDEGAFAAGILAGWTAHKDRPTFRVVTGISAGALIAPFAFLGSDYDGIVRDVATSIGPKDVFHKRNSLIGITSDGMASSEPLAAIVAKHVTPEVLAAVAREYEKGRVLQIGTTDSRRRSSSYLEHG